MDQLCGSPTRRLVDYFVEVVAEPAGSDPFAAGLNPQVVWMDGCADAAVVEENENFERKVVSRIPRVDHGDFPLPDGVPYFCIPESVAFANPSVYERKPIFFSFMLTGGDGSRAYGFVLHYFEAYATPSAEWRPRVFCLISHHPFFSLFKEIVSWVYRNRSQTSELLVAQTKLAYACHDRSWFVSPRNSLSHERRSFTRSISGDFDTGRNSPDKRNGALLSTAAVSAEMLNPGQIEGVLSQLVEVAHAPRSGGILELRIHGEDFFTYHIQRGKAAHLDDYCFQLLFQCLSLKNVVYILNCMLLEQRVLVHSNHQGLLTPVCEALSALLFPFAWEHVYIPFLPLKLIEYLHDSVSFVQAPVPYLIGLHTSSLATRVGSEIFASCVVVHLDKDKVVSPIFSRIDGTPLDFALARLPSKEVDDILRSLSDVVPRPVGTNQGSFSGKDTTAMKKSVAVAQGSPEESNSAADCEVELTFGDGPFGITFESTHLRLLAVSKFEHGRSQPGASAVVKALPRLLNGLPGPAERSGLISAGSFLIGINGESTLDLTFEETIDRLRLEKRPIRLRFLNSELPFENACRFAERLQALSLVSAMQVDRSNVLLPWVDSVRSAFAHMFTSVFRDFQKHISIDHTDSRAPNVAESSSSSRSKSRGPSNKRRRPSTLSLAVAFDHVAYVKSSPVRIREFVREFTQTQSFSGFINDSVLGRLSHSNAFPQSELFKHCVHLIHEIRQIRAAIDLLFERDSTPLETVKLDLPNIRMIELEAVPTINLEQLAATCSSSSCQASPAKRSSSKTRPLEIGVCGSHSDEDVPLDLLKSPEGDDMSDIEDHNGTPSTIGSSPSCLRSLDDEIDGIFDPAGLAKEYRQANPEHDERSEKLA